MDEQTNEWVQGELLEAARHRDHVRPGRPHRVYLRLDPHERDQVAAAAARAGLTPAGFCAEAALGAAETGQIQGSEAARAELRAAMREQFAARTAVNRFGNNVNQAVAALDATGQPPVWLADAVALCARAVREVDATCQRLSRCLNPRRRGTG